MPKALVEAPGEVLDLVLEEAVLPHLVQIEQELQRPLQLEVSQGVAPDQVIRRLVTPEPPSGSAPIVGGLRVNVRMNHGGDRFLFRAEAVFPKDLSPKTGFSGFTVPGAVSVQNGRYRLEADTWTVQHNVWRFRGWV